MNVAEASVALKELSEPWARGERVKVAISRAARLVRFTYWRTFDLWYEKARRVETFEVDAIAEALDRKRREAARNELRDLQARLSRLESLLVQTDPDFHREAVDVLRSQDGSRRSSSR